MHFGVIYLGYVGALWLWRRRTALQARAGATEGSVGAEAVRALVIGGGIVVVGGLIEAVALGEFPGVTWFVVRLLIAVPFTLAWWAAAGRDRAAAVGGGITLSLVLITYSHFLGPVGLPDTNLRLLASDPPPATVHWLSYRDEFLIAFPITLVVAVAAYLAATAWRSGGWSRLEISARQWLATAIALVTLVALGSIAWSQAGPGRDRAEVTASGDAMVERGAYYGGDFEPASGELRLVAENRNPRVTPLPPHDRVELDAVVTHADGTEYEITVRKPLVDDPLGRFGTWWGAGFDRWHHGRSGIGSSLVPATPSPVAVFGVGDVLADGQLVATGVPVHAMTMQDGSVEVDVGDPSIPVPFLPDGHLRVMWPSSDGASPEAPERARNAFGGGVLLVLLVLAVVATRAEPIARRSM